jgi:hypothetical protein
MKSVRALWAAGLFVLVAGLLSACTPTYDWRSVADESQGWQALFPGKPAMVERTISMRIGQEERSVTLMLRAVRIQEQTFTVGVAKFVNPAHSTNLKGLAESLRQSRIQNIRGEVITPTKTKADTEASESAMGLVTAKGQIQLKPNAAPVAATLMTFSKLYRDQVIEAIVVGPAEGFHQEAAQQFLESLRIGF